MSINAFLPSNPAAAVPFTSLSRRLGLEESGSMSAWELRDEVEQFLDDYVTTAEFVQARSQVASFEEAASRGESFVVSRSHPWSIIASARTVLELAQEAEETQERIAWA